MLCVNLPQLTRPFMAPVPQREASPPWGGPRGPCSVQRGCASPPGTRIGWGVCRAGGVRTQMDCTVSPLSSSSAEGRALTATPAGSWRPLPSRDPIGFEDACSFPNILSQDPFKSSLAPAAMILKKMFYFCVSVWACTSLCASYVTGVTGSQKRALDSPIWS